MKRRWYHKLVSWVIAIVIGVGAGNLSSRSYRWVEAHYMPREYWTVQVGDLYYPSNLNLRSKRECETLLKLARLRTKAKCIQGVAV